MLSCGLSCTGLGWQAAFPTNTFLSWRAAMRPHALKNALRIGRQGEIRDRSTEGQHYRMAGLNLLAAIVIYWNTARLGEAVARRTRPGRPVIPELLQ